MLQEGDIIDLGRAFEILHLPGHSPECIALSDPFNQELFSGDVIYDGELLDQLPGSNIYEYLQRLPWTLSYVWTMNARTYCRLSRCQTSIWLSL